MSEATDKIAAILAREGITYAAQFVPQSVSRNSAEKTRTINWRISFSKPGRVTLAFDYQQGIGHIPKMLGISYPQEQSANEWEASERGRYRVRSGMMFMKSLPAPDAADVIYSLVMDDTRGESFEDWAANFGFDSDSRKAEEIYHACVKGTREAQRLFGSAVMAEFDTILQDY